jgi:predicted transcriptional regulator
MVIHLEPTTEERLKELATTSGQSIDQLARQILEDFLAFRNSTQDSSDHWAESSTALTPEVFSDENWEEET